MLPTSSHFGGATHLRSLLSILLLGLFVTAVLGTVGCAQDVQSLVPNHDFSQGVDADGVPLHWTSFARSENAGFEISDERVTVGDYSLYVFDNATDKGAGLRSARVEATPGSEYFAEVDVFVVSGQLTLYVDFLDAGGRRIEAKTASVPSSGSWQKISVQAQAPPNTAYVTLILYSYVPNIGAGYFDNAVLLEGTSGPTTSVQAVQIPPADPGGLTIGFRPEDGSRVAINPPPLIWPPVAQATTYIVEYSLDPSFPADKTFRVTDIDLPLYVGSDTLSPGFWHWRYWGVTGGGTQIGPSNDRTFEITEGIAELPLPPHDEWTARIPSSHPRLFVRPETVADMRGRLHLGSIESLFSRGRLAALAGAEYPEEPANPRAGGVLDIEVWRAAGAQMTPALDTLHELAFLYLTTQKQVYADEGKALLLHFAKMDPSGLTSYRNGAPEVAMRMLYYLPRAYTWLHDVLTEEERDLVRRSAQVRGQEAYSMIKGRPFESNPYGSHPGRMLGFLGQLSIAFLDEVPEARGWLDYVVQLMYAVYPAWGGDEGGYSEGLNYWSSYMNWVFDFFDAFKVATDIDLYQKPFFQNTAYFAMYAASAGTGTPFSDSHNSTPGSGQRTVVTHLARMHQNGYFRWYVDQLGGPLERSSMHQLLLGYPRVPTAQQPDALPNARWFQDIGWVTLHKELANPKANMQFTLKSSPYGSVSHSHADQNAFVLYAYGDGLAISTGYYPWSQSPHHAQWTNQTLSKNSVLIDGRGQPTFNINSKGQILGLFHSDLYDYTVGEAAKAYQNPNLKRFSRHVFYVRPDLFILVDDIKAQRPVTIDWLLHSAFTLEWDEATQVAHTQGRNAALDVHLFSSEPLSASISNRFIPPPEVDSYVNAWHMTATLPGKQDDATIVSLLTPRQIESDGPVLVDASVTSESAWLRIELTHSNGTTDTTEIIHLKLPATNEAADLADVHAIALNGEGNVVRALALGDSSQLAMSRGIVAVPKEMAVAVAWRYDAKTVSVETGRPRFGRSGPDGLQGELVLVANFVPNEVLLDGTVLPADAWSFNAVNGLLTVEF